MEYRGSQCPKRSIGLPHTQGQDGHCVQCREFLTAIPPRPGIPPSATEAGIISTTERLRSLGFSEVGRTLAEKNAVAPAPEPEHDENTPVEPKMITGLGPQGRMSGHGRFHLPDNTLTIRDKARIKSYVEFTEYLAWHGGGER